jgi:hypothetical protein
MPLPEKKARGKTLQEGRVSLSLKIIIRIKDIKQEKIRKYRVFCRKIRTLPYSHILIFSLPLKS